jgi:hypothetical protein
MLVVIFIPPWVRAAASYFGGGIGFSILLLFTLYQLTETELPQNKAGDFAELSLGLLSGYALDWLQRQA